MALQASWLGHLGIDNLNVVRFIGRLLDHGSFSTPLPLVKDGDLIAVVQHMIQVGVPIQQLHLFMIALSRVTVNHGGRGGTAPDPLVWGQGGRKKQRKMDIRVNVDLASLPGTLGFLQEPWVQVHGCGYCCLALQRQPAVQVYFFFLGTLHWPSQG